MNILILSLLFLFTLLSCKPLHQNSCIYQLSPIEKVSLANLDQPFREITSEVCSKETRPILIPDFLEIQTLRSSSIGLMLGELLRSHYSKECRGNIIQVELSKHFQLTHDGLISLTRNPELIKHQQIGLSEAIIGTYSYTDSVLRVFVRQIDVDSGIIKKMITKEIPLTNCLR